MAHLPASRHITSWHHIASHQHSLLHFDVETLTQPLGWLDTPTYGYPDVKGTQQNRGLAGVFNSRNGGCSPGRPAGQPAKWLGTPANGWVSKTPFELRRLCSVSRMTVSASLVVARTVGEATRTCPAGTPIKKMSDTNIFTIVHFPTIMSIKT